MDDNSKSENQPGTHDFTEIEKKAAARAVRSHSLEEVQRAVEIIRSVAERRQELSDLEKACAVGGEATQSRLRRWFGSAGDFFVPNVAAIVAFATAMALIAQVIVARTTATSQTLAQEDSQWRDAMKSVKLSAPDDALMGAFEMQSFFESQRYGQHARSIASTLLPEVEAPNGFDVVFFNLANRICGGTTPGCAANPGLNAEVQRELLGIGRTIANRAHDLFEKTLPDDCAGANCKGQTFQAFVKNPDPFFPAKNPDEQQLGLAWAYSWELDSVSHALANLWAGRRKQIEPQGANLSGLVITGADLSSANFSGTNLSGTHFWETNVTDVDFSNVASVANSEWQDTHWWKARVMSCPLANYLNANFPPGASHLGGAAPAEKLVQNCQPAKE